MGILSTQWIAGPLCCVLGGLAICGMVQRKAQAAEETAEYSLRIDAQALDSALQQFARQSGIQVVFFSNVAEGLQAPALEGKYTLAGALERLLSASGLTFRVLNPRTVQVRPLTSSNKNASRAAATLGKSRRDGRAHKASGDAGKAGKMEEVVVLGVAEQLVATRVATPLREIPQTVSIISREQMRQQSHADLADALAHAPGITMVRTTSLDQQFYSRGYEVRSFHVDGGAALNPKINAAVLFMMTPDLSEFDHIEVLRGADALFGGNGNPGATVSMVRKRPRDVFNLGLSLTSGSWNNHRAEVDVTGPIAFDGALRGRVDAVFAEQDYFYDTAHLERKKIFAAVEYDFAPGSTLTTGGGYQSDDAVPFVSGLPLHKNGRDPRLPRDTALTFDWAFQSTRISEAYVQFRQEFGEDWTLKFNASHWRADVEYGYGVFGQLIDPVTNGLDRGPTPIFTGSPNVHTQVTGDVTLTGVLDWFGMREEVAIGGDFTRFKARLDLHEYTVIGGALADVAAFDQRNYPDPRLTATRRLGFDGTSTLDQYGTFASLRVYFNDAWSAVAGARLGSDSIDSRITVRVAGQSAQAARKFGSLHVLTPHAGVMYALDSNYSLYASYADIYLSNGDLQRMDGSALGAAHGINVEAGLKAQWRDGALNGSVVLYRIAQRNLPMSDTRARPPLTQMPGCCYVGATSRSKGADLELSGELTPGWLVGTGYTYNLNEAVLGGGLSLQTPRHLLKLWTSKRLSGALNRWTVGGSLHAQSDTTSGNNFYCPPGATTCVGFYVIQPAYAKVDLRTAFRINSNWEAALTVNNILDKNYYESLDTPPLHTWYGEPRSFMLRIDGSY